MRISENDVILNVDTEELPGFDEPVSYHSVFGRWRRVAAWVVVANDHRMRIRKYGRFEDLSRVNLRTIQTAYADRVKADHLIFRAQAHNQEMFAVNVAQIVGKDAGGDVRACDCLSQY